MDMALIRRKAAQLRTALLENDVVKSPDNPYPTFDELPKDRQAPWLALAHCYLALFHVQHDRY